MSIRTAPAGAQEDRSMRHRDWMAAAEEEYRRLGALLAELDAADWSRPTDCSEWDVRETVAHLVGAAEGTASVRELRRQQKLGRALRPGEPDVDGMNAVQVRERADTTPEQLRSALLDAGARGVRAATSRAPPRRGRSLGRTGSHTLRHSGMARRGQARNPYSRSWLWIPGSRLRRAPE